MNPNTSSIATTQYFTQYIQHGESDLKSFISFFKNLHSYPEEYVLNRLRTYSKAIISKVGSEGFLYLSNIYYHNINLLEIKPDDILLKPLIEQMFANLSLQDNIDFFTECPLPNPKKIEYLFVKLAHIQSMSQDANTPSQKAREKAYEILNPIYEKWMNDELNLEPQERKYFTPEFLKHLLTHTLYENKITHFNAIQEIQSKLLPFSEVIQDNFPDLIFEATKINMINFLISLGYDKVLEKEVVKTKERALSFFFRNHFAQGNVFLQFHPIDLEGISQITKQLRKKASDTKRYISSDSVYSQENIQKIVTHLEKSYLDSLNSHEHLLSKDEKKKRVKI